MSRRRTIDPEKAIERFNAAFPPGTPVTVKPLLLGKPLNGTIAAFAHIGGGGYPAVWVLVNGKKVCAQLNLVRPT